ncbi:DNA polymerase I [candidate division KSB1 bacterium]|nr:DNA polymerase I [candidate division KSB1 bacterium]
MNQTSQNKRLFLIDGSAVVYRAHFAFIRNPLINSKGINTSAIFGFLRLLFKIQDEHKPDFLGICFDTSKPTFRHETYKEYKATREKMPDELRDQLPILRTVIDALNIPLLECPGWEADDVMATLSQRAAEENIETCLVTGDKDLMQLVSDTVKIYNLRRAGDDTELMDAEAVYNKMGVNPSQVRDYLALVGDSSDNVPGVPKIGAKTAAELLKEFENLEGIYANVEAISKNAVKISLLENRELADLSRKLVTLDFSAPVETNVTDLKINDPHTEQLLELFADLEFNSFVERFKMNTPAIDHSNYKTISSKNEFEQLIANLRAAGHFTFDLETTSADPMLAEIVGLSFSCMHGEAFYLPVQEAQSEEERFDTIRLDSKETADLKPELLAVFADASLAKNGQNAKYDIIVVQNYGIQVNGLAFDTMLASYLLNPSLRQHNLDALALEHLNIVKIPTEDLIGKGKKQITMRQVPMATVARYASEDADVTERLRQFFEPQLRETPMWDLAQEVEIPLINTLVEIERNGVSLDCDFLADMSKEMERNLENLEQEIYKQAGEEFNIASPKQLGTILFEKLRLPTIKKTKTGYSTDASVLEKLALQHELPQNIIAFREISKLKNTYVDALPALVNPRTGRVHTSYNQTVAATGRLSSSNPNLQNIPIRTEMGREIRRAFVPAKSDWFILDADYSQIELRLMAHLSGDKNLQAAFANDGDIHRATAARVFGKNPEEVTADLRRRAKEVNFGIMYGMGAFGLASRLNIEQKEARAIIDEYFLQYPGVNDYIKNTLRQAHDKGVVSTMLGRQRPVPEIKSKNRQVREFAERIAINMPIQGSAADMIKIAMNNIFRRIREEKLTAMMIMQVHDELVFEVPGSELDIMKKIVRNEMENALKVAVPIAVEMGVAGNWLEAH